MTMWLIRAGRAGEREKLSLECGECTNEERHVDILACAARLPEPQPSLSWDKRLVALMHKAEVLGYPRTRRGHTMAVPRRAGAAAYEATVPK
jgi:hypothetical protein